MVKDITIYSTATCAFCFALKKYFNDNNIKFNEKHVDVDVNAAREMFEKSHQMGTPFTVFTKDDDSEIGVVGFNLHQIQEALR